MSREELIDFLKSNLSISISVDDEGYGSESYKVARVELRIDDELIASDSASFDVIRY